MTTSAYAPLTNAEQIFYDLVWSPMVKAGESYLEVQIPILNAPIIKQVDEAVLEGIANYTFQQFKLLIDTTTIKLINSAHQSAYDTASLQLMIIAQESGIDSNDYKAARASALLALSQFSQYGK